MAAAKELSLCWSCRNAVPDRYGNGCSWSRDAIPVAGVADLNRKTDSWHVNRCPEYAQDPPEMIRPDMDTNTEAVDRLRMAILKQAASDYDGAIRYEAKQTKNDVLERQLQKLYGGNYYCLLKYRRIPGRVAECERFFGSDYAKALLHDGDPEYIAQEIRRQEKTAYKIIQKRKDAEAEHRAKSKGE